MDFEFTKEETVIIKEIRAFIIFEITLNYEQKAVIWV